MKYFHRFVFIILLVASMVWACFALKVNPYSLLYKIEIIESLKLLYILGFTAVFWPMFYIEILDYYASVSGRNGKIYFKYAKSIRKDIVVSTLAALILGSIYWFNPTKYDFSGIDLGFIGIPFLMHAIYTYFQIMSLTIGGKPVNKLPVVIMLVAVAAFTLLSYSVLFKNSSGNFETYQAIWFQLTILFGSFFIFTSANLQFQFVIFGKFELSQFKKYFFSEVIRSRQNIYSGMEEPLRKLNKQMAAEKSKHAASLRKRRSRK
ncbi:hypothetical protein ACEUAI_10275 [Aeromonas veronii]|uniref:hypothetical protein n=1 Tax=Aeromonas veronii TaxID=654 RepID=UPI0038EDF834